jgi:hypothetical protein
MNCKQGDIAVIVRSAANNEGRIVTCLEYVGLAGHDGLVETEHGIILMQDGDYWRVDIKLNIKNSRVGTVSDCAPYVRDSCLMPISGYKEPLQVKKEEEITQ